MRELRRERPWLRRNLSGDDRLTRIDDGGGTGCWGVRREPRGACQLLVVVNLEGDDLDVSLDGLGVGGGWRVLLRTPGLVDGARRWRLADGAGVLLERRMGT